MIYIVDLRLLHPVSSSSTSLSAKEFYLKNFHIEGYEGSTVLTETITSAEIPMNPISAVSTVSNITARNILPTTNT
jgi:hypothetical protein